MSRRAYVDRPDPIVVVLVVALDARKPRLSPAVIRRDVPAGRTRTTCVLRRHGDEMPAVPCQLVVELPAKLENQPRTRISLYSSLANLRAFPITCFKIDMSFINRAPGTEADIAIVRTILALGIPFKVEVVAEGVETAEQAEFLLG